MDRRIIPSSSLCSISISAFCQIGAQGFLLLVFQLSLIPEVAEIDAGGDRY